MAPLATPLADLLAAAKRMRHEVARRIESLAQANKALREALRKVAIRYLERAMWCAVCDECWAKDEPERHAPTCLASPRDK